MDSYNGVPIRSHFLGHTFRWSCSDPCHGVIERVLKNNSPEMSPNISFYSEDEYPHLHFALSCGILSSFCFPFKGTESAGSGDYDVMEIVSTCNPDVETLRTFCQPSKRFHWSWRCRDTEFQEYAQPVPEIDRMLVIVSQTFHLPLTQYWIFNEEELLLVKQFSGGVSENLAQWCQFKDAYFHKPFSEYEGPLGRPSKGAGAFFCRDITALSITQYPFSHYLGNCGSIASFTINLRSQSSPYHEWILQFFFLPAQQMDNDYPQTLLNSLWEKIKECFPADYKLASGEQLGQGFSVQVIDAFKVGQPHTSLPHQEASMFSQKAATGETPKRTPNEASPPRRFEEYFEILGSTVAADRVDNSVELSTDEDVEYAVTAESKRHKKSIIPFTKENISKHFGKPLKDAAESFGVSRSTFKRRCRDFNITWWQPSKRKLIATEKGNQNVSSSMRPLQDTPIISHTSQVLEKITVTATYKEFTIKFGLTNLSGMSELEDNVIKRLKLKRNSFSIKYQDNDNKLILIACDEDVQECMEFSKMAKKATIEMLIHPPVNHYSAP
ncbi:protein NLP6-like isoform X1 [Apium graveolens]|uniref:protein NLP6-like isoform X1 n=2 Tax=Apium graveolens TaxID=4045 RepID=UPI003D7A6907